MTRMVLRNCHLQRIEKLSTNKNEKGHLLQVQQKSKSCEKNHRPPRSQIHRQKRSQKIKVKRKNKRRPSSGLMVAYIALYKLGALGSSSWTLSDFMPDLTWSRRPPIYRNMIQIIRIYNIYIYASIAIALWCSMYIYIYLYIYIHIHLYLLYIYVNIYVYLMGVFCSCVYQKHHPDFRKTLLHLWMCNLHLVVKCKHIWGVSKNSGTPNWMVYNGNPY